MTKRGVDKNDPSRATTLIHVVCHRDAPLEPATTILVHMLESLVNHRGGIAKTTPLQLAAVMSTADVAKILLERDSSCRILNTKGLDVVGVVGDGNRPRSGVYELRCSKRDQEEPRR